MTFDTRACMRGSLAVVTITVLLACSTQAETPIRKPEDASVDQRFDWHANVNEKADIRSAVRAAYTARIGGAGSHACSHSGSGARPSCMRVR